jgi:hypothetical protein
MFKIAAELEYHARDIEDGSGHDKEDILHVMVRFRTPAPFVEIDLPKLRESNG